MAAIYAIHGPAAHPHQSQLMQDADGNYVRAMHLMAERLFQLYTTNLNLGHRVGGGLSVRLQNVCIAGIRNFDRIGLLFAKIFQVISDGLGGKRTWQSPSNPIELFKNGEIARGFGNLALGFLMVLSGLLRLSLVIPAVLLRHTLLCVGVAAAAALTIAHLATYLAATTVFTLLRPIIYLIMQLAKAIEARFGASL